MILGGAQTAVAVRQPERQLEQRLLGGGLQPVAHGGRGREQILDLALLDDPTQLVERAGTGRRIVERLREQQALVS